MDIDQQLIERKLAILKDYIRQIEHMDFSKEQLLDQTDIQQLLSFRLQQAVETAIGIASHIVAGLDIPRQESARNIFEKLGEKDIINQNTASKMALACGFRNIVVHGYQEIDFNIVYRDYKKDLKSLRNFARQIHTWLIKRN